MLKGGYQIIDFGDTNHTLGVGMVHEGIYAKIENTRKALLLSGLIFEGSELHDIFAFPTVSAGSYVIPIMTMGADSETPIIIKIVIEDTDVVTVSIAST